MTTSGTVGIDLGTTHTVVAYAPNAHEAARVLPIPQLVSDHEVEAGPLLPSFLYTPAEAESAVDPWNERPWVVGQYARQRGQEVADRLISSAKSWLSHSAVDRRAQILPWGQRNAEIPKISPVEASRRVLDHVRHAWGAAFPDSPLAEQRVVLTVPASFDEVARELTVEAAEGAGLTVRLLEEPQAAFYDLIASPRRAAVEALLSTDTPRASVLVCDVGGGTTDLTLIAATRGTHGQLELERVAVGRHLLLGGDNVDLALAHSCERKLLGRERLDPLRFARLLLACRDAKETLLGRAPPDAVPIRVAALGSSLVGGTLTCELGQSEVEQLVFQGFLPFIDASPAPPSAPARAGLVAFGLPYERDAAISRHIVAFLRRHCPGGADALLLNGGLFHAARAADRVRQIVSAFGGREVALLPYPDPDLSVARGAVAYGQSLEGAGLRIGGGTPRGFYMAVDERALGRALCVVPKGAREGERHVARQDGLWLRVGEPVRLELYTSDARRAEQPGDLVLLDDSFAALPPVTTHFQANDAGSPRELEVGLQGELTATGTVELSSVEASPPAGREARRFRLTFDLRQNDDSASDAGDASAHRGANASLPPPASAKAQSASESRLAAAREAIQRVLGEGRADVSARESKDLPRELERLLGERRTWTLAVSRALFDAVAEGRTARRRSADHERVFWMLAGYCLRPGFGAAHDEARVAQVAPLFESAVAADAGTRTWQQFWIAWRRIVQGLREDTQTRMLALLEPLFSPSEQKLKRSRSLRAPESPAEMLEFAAALERVPVARRVNFGNWLIERTWTDRDPGLWRALGRIGARVPGYASAHHVVPPAVAEQWLDHLLRERWNELPSAAEAAVQLARITGDRERDVSAAAREEVVRRLGSLASAEDKSLPLRELVPVAEAEWAAWFGEELPVGFRLAT